MGDPRFALVIFDCDGVLVDSEPIANRVLLDIVAELGLPMGADECSRTFLGRSAPACCAIIEERLGRALNDRFLGEWEQRLHEAFRREVAAVHGVVEVLDQLRMPFCVASSGSHARMGVTLGTAGLLARFHGRIFSGADVGRGKPFPDVFLHAAARMHVSPERCAVTEDTVVGIRAGVAAGMTVFGFAGAGHTDPRELRQAGARTFRDMLELPALLD